MIRVLIVDDQRLIRAAVSELLRAEPDVEVIGEASDGADAVAATRRLAPDVVLMDIRMPVMDGIAATQAICADPSRSDVRVLILTTFEEDENLVASLRAGASGFIGKGAEPDEIARAVRAVHAGDALSPPRRLEPSSTATSMCHSRGSRAPTQLCWMPSPHASAKILLLVGRGMSNDEIAEALQISPHTAKTHMNRVMGKLDAHDRAQLVIWADETGIIARGR